VTVAGVDLGGSKIAGVLLDDQGAVLAQVWREHHSRGPESALALIEEVVAELADPDRPAVQAVGVSVAGWLPADRQELLTAANLGIARLPLARLLADRLGCPVWLENDGNATALAEYTRGAGRGAQVLALFTLGTGVGGALVADGSVVAGRHGLAGELGHLPVDRAGPRCTCGARGCLEMAASGPAIAARARRLASRVAGAPLVALAGGQASQITARHVVAAAQAGDELSRQVLAQAGRAVGRAVAMTMAVADPDLVVLGGSVAVAAGPLILDPARQEVARNHPLLTMARAVPIVLAQAGPAAAALGAADLARDRHDRARS
jgi:glucokinase